MIDRAQKYGCKDIGLILDRGYFSLNNIKYFERKGYQYVLMTKGNDKFIQQALNEVGVKVKNGYSGYIDAYELYGTTVKINLFNSDSKQYVHVFYNGIEAEKEKIQSNKRYANMDAKLDDLKSKKIKRKEDVLFYEEYYRLKYDANGYFIAHQRKMIN